ncbi:IclR family transcriptional regulator [Nocardia sp. NPDC059239]|uniref:IclR family transcriptional regulator n=1 Tax=Nocardia sp. NPDC059239 TaxID=3346785 RepID=UPI0036ADCB55
MSNATRTLGTVATALHVLRLLADHQCGMGITEIARSLDISKSKAHLMIATLLSEGFVERTANGRYQLGAAAFEVGSAVSDAARLGGELLEPMRALADLCGEAVSLAVPRHREAIMVQRFETKRVLRDEIGIGTRMPLTSCASGKFLLAHMSAKQVESRYPDETLPRVTANSVRSRSDLMRMFPEIRQAGYAVNDEEYMEGVRGIATGVSDGTGHYIAALSIAGPANRFHGERWIEPLIDAAHEMTEPLSNRLRAQIAENDT